MPRSCVSSSSTTRTSSPSPSGRASPPPARSDGPLRHLATAPRRARGRRPATRSTSFPSTRRRNSIPPTARSAAASERRVGALEHLGREPLGIARDQERVAPGPQRPARRLRSRRRPPSAPAISSASVNTVTRAFSATSAAQPVHERPAERRDDPRRVERRVRARAPSSPRGSRLSNAAANGTRSRATSRSCRVRPPRAPRRGCPSSVAPWPGQCFAVGAAPPRSAPRTNAAPSAATRSGSQPNERLPTIGLRGSLRTSSTGANSTSTPTDRASRAVVSPNASASASDAAEPPHARVGQHPQPAHLLPGAALHVAGDEDRPPRLVPQPRRQAAHLLRLAAEEAEARDPRLPRPRERRLLLGLRVLVEADPGNDQREREGGHGRGDRTAGLRP